LIQIMVFEDAINIFAHDLGIRSDRCVADHDCIAPFGKEFSLHSFSAASVQSHL